MLKTINLAAKVVAVVGAAIVLTAVGMWAATSHTMWTQYESKQRADGEQSIRSLALVFAGRMKDAKVTLDGQRVARIKIAVPLRLLRSFHRRQFGILCRRQRDRFQLRRCPERLHPTHDHHEEGERRPGGRHRLADDSPAQAFVRKGEAYYGLTTLSGRRFYTVYQPTFDEAGRVNGILHVGIPIEDYFGVYEDSLQTMALAAGGIALLVCLTAEFIATRLFKPLHAMARRVEALAAGDLDSPIAHQDRDDEIGGVARALEVLRDTSAARAVARRGAAQGRGRRRPAPQRPRCCDSGFSRSCDGTARSRSRPRRRECAGGRRTC